MFNIVINTVYEDFKVCFTFVSVFERLGELDSWLAPNQDPSLVAPGTGYKLF